MFENDRWEWWLYCDDDVYARFATEKEANAFLKIALAGDTEQEHTWGITPERINQGKPGSE